MAKDVRDVYGEYDPPLPVVNPNPTKEDKEKLKQLEAKYLKLAEERKLKLKNA